MSPRRALVKRNEFGDGDYLVIAADVVPRPGGGVDVVVVGVR